MSASPPSLPATTDSVSVSAPAAKPDAATAVPPRSVRRMRVRVTAPPRGDCSHSEEQLSGATAAVPPSFNSIAEALADLGLDRGSNQGAPAAAATNSHELAAASPTASTSAPDLSPVSSGIRWHTQPSRTSDSLILTLNEARPVAAIAPNRFSFAQAEGAMRPAPTAAASLDAQQIRLHIHEPQLSPPSAAATAASPPRGSVLSVSCGGTALSARDVSAAAARPLLLDVGPKKSAMRSFPSPRPQFNPNAKPAATAVASAATSSTHPPVKSSPPRRTRLSSCLYALNTFPLKVPYSKNVVLTLFHPNYLAFSLALTLIGVFALDCTLAFFPPGPATASLDRVCDGLLLSLAFLWAAELFILSLTLPGYFLANFWFYMDALALVSVLGDIGAAPLQGMGFGEPASALAMQQTETGSSSQTGSNFSGFTSANGSAHLWLALHYARFVRVCRFWNGSSLFGGTGVSSAFFSIECLFARIENWMGDSATARRKARMEQKAAKGTLTNFDRELEEEEAKAAAGRNSAALHRSSALGLHLTNRIQKKITLILLLAVTLVTLLHPLPAPFSHIPDDCRVGAPPRVLAAAGGTAARSSVLSSPMSDGSGNMQQWVVTHLDALYNVAAASASVAAAASSPATATAASLLPVQPSYLSMQSMADSLTQSFSHSDDSLLLLSVGPPRLSSRATDAAFGPILLASADADTLGHLRRIDVNSFRCGNSIMLLSRVASVRAAAAWSLLLLSSVLLLYVLSVSFLAYDVATLVARPLERMARSLRKMAGTVLFLHQTEQHEEGGGGGGEDDSGGEEEQDAAIMHNNDDGGWGVSSTMDRRRGSSVVAGTPATAAASSILRRGSVTPRSNGSGRLASSSSSWYLNNAGGSGGQVGTESGGGGSSISSGAGGKSSSSASRWIRPGAALPLHAEFDLLEMVLGKISAIFQLLPGGSGLGTQLSRASSSVSVVTSDGSMTGGGGGGGVGDDGDADKAHRMMVGSRRTEIRTRDSILTIDVVERPLGATITADGGALVSSPSGGGISTKGRASSPSSHRGQGGRTAPRVVSFAADVAAGSNRQPRGSIIGGPLSDVVAGNSGVTVSAADALFFSSSTLLQPVAVTAASTSSSSSSSSASRHPLQAAAAAAPLSPIASSSAASAVLFSSAPELRSLDEFLSVPLGALHFRQYLSRQFSLESLSFSEAVSTWRTRCLAGAARIYSAYVAAGAAHEINIPSHQRLALAQEMQHAFGPRPTAFDQAQMEVHKLIKTKFAEFRQGPAAQNYINAKQQGQLTIRVGEDDIF